MVPDVIAARRVSQLALVGAFATVYIVWGSTYLAIRVMVETAPPFFAAGARFFIAGAILYLFLRARGHGHPPLRDWGAASVTGFLMLAVGNGGITWAEERVPSNIAALIAGTTPFWIAIIDWLRPGGTRPTVRTMLGLAIGFLGIAILLSPRGPGEAPSDRVRMLACLVAGLGWASGALHSRYAKRSSGMGMAIAQNMLMGGAELLVIAALVGESDRLRHVSLSAPAIIAFAYLVVFGSLVTFSAYIWLLRVSTPARVSTTAYVNPLVAVLLGWLFLDETLSGPAVWAAALIIVSVVATTVPSAQRRTP